ncbi:MarR family transcriptional regulator [Streptomyces sp. DH37]|uniref:MarR family transcriptional regulator n=1 Tax=Streptomyces sp. DH37 TaxID=3040122 RepID=UPI00244301BC|nr:MarR family transcriptional regulator [Streptomyces sp. DH37]MDG9702709.1 MarR family transcriptional regulator [Streptomyces sp. DH37]
MEGKSRPDASADQALAAMDRLIALSLVGQHDIAQRLGLNVTDLTCLGHILGAAGNGRPLNAGDLAALANLTSGAVTGVLDRLERAGYARREPDPADRRRVRIVPDDSAAERVTAVYEPFYQGLSELFADYGTDEIAVLNDWFTRAAELMGERLEEIRRGGAD